jgi:hypothetical protein
MMSGNTNLIDVSKTLLALILILHISTGKELE